jgi:Cullin family
MVERLLTFKSNASLVLSFPASSSSLTQDFRYALHDAFSNGFKKRHNKPAEMIAHHIDKLLRKGQGSSSDEVFNEQLDAALGLYRFTADKDVFRAFYHRALAKRLLLGRSASDDAEKAMLKKLKEGANLSTSIISWRFNTFPVTQTMTLNLVWATICFETSPCRATQWRSTMHALGLSVR